MTNLNLRNIALASVMLASSLAQADVPANYFRVWEGFKRPDLSEEKFLGELPSFMAETVKLYGGRALSNYIVVMPPKKKPRLFQMNWLLSL